MENRLQYIEPFTPDFNVFLRLLREHQLLKDNGPSLTPDQIVYVAGVLNAFARNDFAVGGMKISDPTDLAMPEVLEHLFYHRAEAEIAGCYLLACFGTMTTPLNNSSFPAHRVFFYDVIARSCFNIVAEASKNPGHRHVTRSVATEYREIKKEVNRFIVSLNKNQTHPDLAYK